MSIIDFVFPKNCLNCKKKGRYICRNCLSKVRHSKQICPECNKPSIDGFTHTRCKRKYNIDGLFSIWKYDGVIRKAIISLKYKYVTEVSNELLNNLLPILKNNDVLLPGECILVPIPIHWYRENTRGFNQSVEIGRQIARGMRWKFAPDILLRKKNTPSQVKLRGGERKNNVKGVFVLRSYPIFKPSTYSVIIFDDVYTTGSTLREASKVLKRAGIKRVWGLTMAR